jgi:hypothetical protein
MNMSLPVGLRVEGSLCQEDWVLLRGDTKLVIKGVMLKIKSKLIN